MDDEEKEPTIIERFWQEVEDPELELNETDVMLFKILEELRILNSQIEDLYYCISGDFRCD